MTFVIMLQFVDNGKNDIPLKIIKYIANFTLPKTSCFIGKNVLWNRNSLKT